MRALASRISYVGELGWEIYAPMEQGLRAVGRRSGRRASRTGSCPVGIGVYGTTGRIEKGYRALRRRARVRVQRRSRPGWPRPKVKDADFVGKDAYLRHREEEPAAILSTLTVDDPTSSSGVKRYLIGRRADPDCRTASGSSIARAARRT